MDASVVSEIAERYRAMLARFEQMADSTGQNLSMAERLNNILQELISTGGIPLAQMAERRSSLAHVLSSLHEFENDVAGLLESGKIL